MKVEDGRFYDSVGRDGLQVTGKQPFVQSSRQQCRVILAEASDVHGRFTDPIESDAEACHKRNPEQKEPLIWFSLGDSFLSSTGVRLTPAAYS
jgi:hypothetical protein